MSYSISQVEELTGVKSHILRYWEEVVPGFNPQKTLTGQRYFTQREVEMIFRLKYLINEKKFTAEGAGKQIIDESEAAADNVEILRQIQKIRAELSDLYFLIKSRKSQTQNLQSEENSK